MMSQDNIENRDELLVAEYVIGVMPHAQRLSFESRLAEDTYLQQRVIWWNDKLLPLTDEVGAVNVSPLVYKKIEKELFSSAQPESSWWNSLGLWRGLATLSIAGLLVITTLFGLQNYREVSPTKEVFVSEIAGKESDLKLIALYDSQSKTLKMNRLQGQAAKGRDFEIWLIPEKQKPISLGVLSRDDLTEVMISEKLHKDMTSNSILAISDEPLGGSPTGQATGPVVALGKIISM